MIERGGGRRTISEFSRNDREGDRRTISELFLSGA